MTEKKRVDLIIDSLFNHYPDAQCNLQADGNPFQLLIMAILSAQCTDKRVNEVSIELFKRFPNAQSINESAPGELEKYIHSVGLYNSKAKSIRACCKTLTDEFENEIPSEMESLLKLGGVGRKVANLIRGDIFGLGGIVADTHCIRISNRLGLADSTNPYIVEKSLSPIIPIDVQSAFCHTMVVFGRDICTSRSPKCEKCFLKKDMLCDGVIKESVKK